jgi:RNA polymerase sigma-70 factor, ECF subfamily
VRRWTDRSLARRIAAGDHDACAALIATHHKAIYRLLVRLCCDAHLAEDLTQETFAAAWENIEGYRGASSLSTWLHQIAYRKFLDSRRRAKRAVATEFQHFNETGVSAADPVADPVADAIAGEEARRLHLALDRLPQRERDVLVMHYLQSLSYRDVAVVLDEPVGTVKWRTSRALDELKNLLEAPYDEYAQFAAPAAG